MAKEKEKASYANTVDDQDTLPTNVGGKIDQPTFIWLLPNDTGMQQRQQMPLQSSAMTTLLPQNADRLDQMQLDETGSCRQTALKSINATLTIDRKYTDQTQVQHWAILIYTGAMTSVASKEHFTNMLLGKVYELKIHTSSQLPTEKRSTSTESNKAIPTTFIISDVNCAILGIDTIDGLYSYVDYTQDFTNWYYNWYDACNQDNMVKGLLQEDAQPLPIYGDNIIGDQSEQEASIPKTLKTPTTQSQSEIDEHNLSHLPSRDWCKHCVQGKSRQHYHQRGGLTKQSITQIDYAFLKSDNDKHNARGLLTELGRQMPHVKIQTATIQPSITRSCRTLS
eukprot:6135235-Amphidinium_carterae.10